MKPRIIAAVALGVWVAAVGSAAALVYVVNHPALLTLHAAVIENSATIEPVSTSERSLLPNADEEVFTDSTVLELPTVTVYGTPRSRTLGVTEMQPSDTEVIIGPGIVTHPR